MFSSKANCTTVSWSQRQGILKIYRNNTATLQKNSLLLLPTCITPYLTLIKTSHKTPKNPSTENLGFRVGRDNICIALGHRFQQVHTGFALKRNVLQGHSSRELSQVGRCESQLGRCKPKLHRLVHLSILPSSCAGASAHRSYGQPATHGDRRLHSCISGWHGSPTANLSHPGYLPGHTSYAWRGSRKMHKGQDFATSPSHGCGTVHSVTY